jgi:hypothetical protein
MTCHQLQDFMTKQPNLERRIATYTLVCEERNPKIQAFADQKIIVDDTPSIFLLIKGLKSYFFQN